MKFCIRLTLIFKKRHDVPSSYAFKEQKKYTRLPALTPAKFHKMFFCRN